MARDDGVNYITSSDLGEVVLVFLAVYFKILEEETSCYWN